MPNIWVCKFDGTIQCDEDSKEITLEEMRKQLAALIGDDNILDMKKSSRPMITLCGMPTGRMNSYEITEKGWFVLSRGIVGPQGFERCEEDIGKKEKAGAAEADINIGQVIGICTSSNPVFIRELIGHPIRVYKTGDPLTKDWRPDRVNIETDAEGIIVKVWFG